MRDTAAFLNFKPATSQVSMSQLHTYNKQEAPPNRARTYIHMQAQLRAREGAAEVHGYVEDLERWEVDIKVRDEKLRAATTGKNKVNESVVVAKSKEDALPPVRAATKMKLGEQAQPVASPVSSPVKKEELTAKPQATDADKKRISSYDYRSWDKFDVVSTTPQ